MSVRINISILSGDEPVERSPLLAEHLRRTRIAGRVGILVLSRDTSEFIGSGEGEDAQRYGQLEGEKIEGLKR